MRRLLMVLFVIFLSAGMAAADEKAGEHMKIPEEYEHMKNPMANMMSEAVDDGKKVYAANCASCHGTPSQVAIQEAPYFYDKEVREHVLGEMSDGTMFYVVSKGIEGEPMPAWEKMLSEEQRWHVVTFLKGGSGTEMTAEKMSAIATAPTPVPAKKGICGPSALLAFAALPAFTRLTKRR